MNGDNTPAFLETIHKLLTIYRHLRTYSREMHSEGLSGRKVATLRYLLDVGPLTIGQLRDYLYVSDSTTSELVAALEEAGYVTRARSEEDNRVVVVSLTPAGHEFSRSAPLGGIPLLRERLRTLPSERLALIDEALAEVKQLLGIEDEQ